MLLQNVFLGYSNLEMTVFSTQGSKERHYKTSALGFQRTDFDLFRTLTQKVPWEAAFKNKEAQEGWIYFKKEILKTQKWAVLMC